MVTKSVGYKTLKNNFEVVFRIIVNLMDFRVSMFIPKVKNAKRTGFVFRVANVIFVYSK